MLKPILQNIFSKSQSVFVPIRLISKNILASYECLSVLYERDRYGKVGSVVMKLYIISQVYNRVKCGFFERVMVQMGLLPGSR